MKYNIKDILSGIVEGRTVYVSAFYAKPFHVPTRNIRPVAVTILKNNFIEGSCEGHFFPFYFKPVEGTVDIHMFSFPERLELGVFSNMKDATSFYTNSKYLVQKAMEDSIKLDTNLLEEFKAGDFCG